MPVSGPVLKATGAAVTACSAEVVGVCAYATCVSGNISRHNVARCDRLGDFMADLTRGDLTTNQYKDGYATQVNGPRAARTSRPSLESWATAGSSYHPSNRGTRCQPRRLPDSGKERRWLHRRYSLPGLESHCLQAAWPSTPR